MNKNIIFYYSLLMTFNAGFVDTSTFTVADEKTGLFKSREFGWQLQAPGLPMK
ncbi:MULTISPECIES: hypothetical protein [Sphingobacterium]|uniref:hypothetical protein n=1 Tax=Sphingobacterium TaxID=28453 RepID=UPI00257F5F3C|nr:MULTISPECIES: hypothetical protein [Sphingobacterium]